MFSSKSTRGKWTWALVDLLVVIAGVYIAFMIQLASSDNKAKKEKIKIYAALKTELEEFRVSFPMFADGNRSYLKEVEGKDIRTIGWRFIEPQYGYKILEYGIDIQNTEIIDFETFEELKKIYVAIKQLEHMERLITEVAGEYQYLIDELPESHPLNLERKANNEANTFRFRMFLEGRVFCLERIAKEVSPLLNKINEELEPSLKKQ
ncbi:MAG: hypothetical protein AAFY41_07080, partial [Bacteroidota bacterium]